MTVLNLSTPMEMGVRAANWSLALSRGCRHRLMPAIEQSPTAGSARVLRRKRGETEGGSDGQSSNHWSRAINNILDVQAIKQAVLCQAKFYAMFLHGFEGLKPTRRPSNYDPHSRHPGSCAGRLLPHCLSRLVHVAELNWSSCRQRDGFPVTALRFELAPSRPPSRCPRVGARY